MFAEFSPSDTSFSSSKRRWWRTSPTPLGPVVHASNGRPVKRASSASTYQLQSRNWVQVCRSNQFPPDHFNNNLRICKAWYHMDCVNPPLPAKPTRGYSWMCSQCMHDRVARNGGRPGDHVAVVPVTQVALGRPGRGKAKEKALPIDYDKPDAFFRGWNFRYFG